MDIAEFRRDRRIRGRSDRHDRAGSVAQAASAHNRFKPESEIYLIPKIGGGYFLSLSLRGAAGAAAISFSEIASPGTAHQGWPSGDRNDIAAHSSGNPAARIPGKYTVSHRSRSAGVYRAPLARLRATLEKRSEPISLFASARPRSRSPFKP